MLLAAGLLQNIIAIVIVGIICLAVGIFNNPAQLRRLYGQDAKRIKLACAAKTIEEDIMQCQDAADLFWQQRQIDDLFDNYIDELPPSEVHHVTGTLHAALCNRRACLQLNGVL
ncbi:MAG: hypothetical protein SFU21_09950 [Flavihumibacter sp.]|nr:hypothetical protein [Flavihumibacter sp.]